MGGRESDELVESFFLYDIDYILSDLRIVTPNSVTEGSVHNRVDCWFFHPFK